MAADYPLPSALSPSGYGPRFFHSTHGPGVSRYASIGFDGFSLVKLLRLVFSESSVHGLRDIMWKAIAFCAVQRRRTVVQGRCVAA